MNDEFSDIAAAAVMAGATPDAPQQADSVDRDIAYLDGKIASENLKPATAPLYKWTSRQRQSLYSMVGSIAQTIENRIIRPADPSVVAELRRAEAAAHSSVSASTVSLYKTRSANPRYGTSGPLGWSDTKKVVFASGAGADTDEPKHTHTTQLTLPLDIRFVRGQPALLYEPFDEAMFNTNPHFPYLCISNTTRSAITALNAHSALVQFADSFRESRQILPLGDLLKLAANDCGLTLHGVLFRHDNSIELMYSLDLDGRYFGILSLRLSTLQQVGVYRRQSNQRHEAGREVRERTLRELRAAVVPLDEPSTIGAAGSKHRVEQMVAAVASKAGAVDTSDAFEFFDFSTLGVPPKVETATMGVPGAKQPAPLTGLAPDSKDSRLLARCLTLIVFDPRRSPTLNAAPVQFAYHYFVSCQCGLKRKELRAVKRLYGTAARIATSDLAIDHLLPRFDSDDELNGRRSMASSSTSVLMDSHEMAQQRFEDRYRSKRTKPTE